MSFFVLIFSRSAACSGSAQDISALYLKRHAQTEGHIRMRRGRQLGTALVIYSIGDKLARGNTGRYQRYTVAARELVTLNKGRRAAPGVVALRDREVCLFSYVAHADISDELRVGARRREEVAGRVLAVADALELAKPCGIEGISLTVASIAVYRHAVCVRSNGGIIGTLHSTLDFKRIDTRFAQLGHVLYHA